MPNYFGGYYLPSPATRRILKNMQIDDTGIDYWRINFPINDWLAKHAKKDVFGREPRRRPRNIHVAGRL